MLISGHPHYCPEPTLVALAEAFDGEARFLTDRTERERAIAMMRRKYWVYRPLFAFGQILTAIAVVRDRTGAFEVTLAG